LEDIDDEDDEESSDESESHDDNNYSSSAEEWDAHNQNSDDEDEDEEGEDANRAANACMFCHQPENISPDDMVEDLLACVVCRDHDPSNWRCPECQNNTDATANRDSLTNHNANHDRKSTPVVESQQSLATFPDGNNTPESARSLRKRTMTAADEEEAAFNLRKRLRQGSALPKRGSDDAGDDDDQPPSSRSLRIKRNKHISILRKGPKSLIVKIRVKPVALRLILEQPPAGMGRGRRGARTISFGGTTTAVAAIETPAAPFTYISQPFYSFFDRETDEAKGKPYGGILTDTEADTTKTLPVDEDRKRFVEAKSTAEEEWRNRLLRTQPEMLMMPKKPKRSRGPGSQIECIDFGGWEIDTTYAAPYPEEYSRNRILYICEFCLKYMNSDYVAWRHKLKCPAKYPPGDEIYRHKSVSVFEVDGRKHPVYCQNLCLLAKLFLGSKTLYYDVEPFLFYVLCEYDELGYHFVGYFSKEKRASSQNNVSCILTLPIHQRKGYGNLLIDFSYLLTRVEHKTGSPEKPLSDMGLVSYRNYWRLALCKYFIQHYDNDQHLTQGLSIRQISEDTGLTADDVISALEGLRCLVRDPETQLYAFRVDLNYCRNYVATWDAKKYVKLEPTALTWTPYVMGRGVVNHFDLAPSLSHLGEDDDQDHLGIDGSSINDNAHGSVLEASGKNGVMPQLQTSDSEMILASTESRAASMMGDVNPMELDDEKSTQKWATAYEGIPPTRFQVFPLTVGGRRLDSIRHPPVSASSAPSAPRAPVSRKRNTTTTIKKKAAGRPKATPSRKRKGGTGRGPGRWPKGTKKSDYGNADSGPGLPPGWIARNLANAAAAAVASRTKKEDAPLEPLAMPDTVGTSNGTS
ncbi:hypothetical protein TD95_004450, partial [Thielaviopsis punctulata]